MDTGLQEVKSIIKSLIISSPQGVTIWKLDKDYRDTVGTNIPYARLGYPNLEFFLKSLTDTLLVLGSGSTAKVAAISDKKTKHLEEMISRQKNTTRERRNLSFINKKPISPPLLNLPPVVTITKPPVYYSGQYINTTFHPHQQWVPVPCSTYYNYNQYTSSTNYHWNIAPNQLNQQITHMQNKLNQVHICSKQNSATHTTTTENNRQAPRSPKTRLNLSTQQSNIARCQPQLQPQPELRPQFQSQPQPQFQPQPQSQPQAQSQTPSKAQPEKAELIAIKSQQNGSAKEEEENLLFEEPKKLLSFKINGKESKVRTPNKHFIGPKSSSSESSESTVAERNTSTDLGNTTNSSENKNKESILDIEAVPELEHNDIIFLIDYPAGTVKFGGKIKPAEIPSNIIKDSWFAIFVTEIHNPFKFWFHIYEENSELDSLMQDIENFYIRLPRDELQMQRYNIKPGQVCAALFLGMWHRAEILESPVEGKVKLFFVDYGTIAEVSVLDIKYLLEEYSNLRCQAYRGSLAFIKPVAHRWSRDVTYAFMNMVNELLLYAKVTEIDNNERKIQMIIADTNDEKDFQINEALVLKGLAKFCDKEFEKYNNKEPFTTIDRHFQEKYPTFDMLESGQYPSFIEIGDLLAKGIDFEARQDENILPDVDENCSLEEITKQLTIFNVGREFKCDSSLEEVEDLPPTPVSKVELNDLDDIDVEPVTKTNLEISKQVLNPFTNPFIPKNRRINTEDIMPNSLETTSQNSSQIVPIPSPQLQPNSYETNPFNMPMMASDMQNYNSLPSFCDTMSMPGIQTTPVQTPTLYTSNWNQFANVPNISNYSQQLTERRPTIPPGFENQFPQPTTDIFNFR